jgi:hypothetical protein
MTFSEQEEIRYNENVSLSSSSINWHILLAVIEHYKTANIWMCTFVQYGIQMPRCYDVVRNYKLYTKDMKGVYIMQPSIML